MHPAAAFTFFIIKESCINRSQQFSGLQSHYIYGEGMESNKKKLIGGMRQLGQEPGQGRNKSEVSLTLLWHWGEREVVNFNGRR